MHVSTTGLGFICKELYEFWAKLRLRFETLRKLHKVSRKAPGFSSLFVQIYKLNPRNFLHSNHFLVIEKNSEVNKFQVRQRLNLFGHVLRKLND